VRYESVGTPRRRAWALVFEAGDTVLEGLHTFATEVEARTSRVTGIGACSEATIAFFDRGTRHYDEIPVPEQVEVLSLIGNLTLDPAADHRFHLHAVLGRRDGSTLGGHFVNGTVWPTLEVFVEETSAVLERRTDPESGLPLIVLEGP
jgi:predicted DNA-binding protein with PD1-like motif